jgi:hypothetical protein
MPFALPLLFSPSPLPLRSLANHTVIRSKFVAKITSVYETVLPTFCHKNSIRPLAPLRSFYIGTWPYCDIFICSPSPQRTTVYLPAPTSTYELPPNRSLLYRHRLFSYGGFFLSFFPPVFSCAGVWGHPQSYPLLVGPQSASLAYAFAAPPILVCTAIQSTQASLGRAGLMGNPYIRVTLGLTKTY